MNNPDLALLLELVRQHPQPDQVHLLACSADPESVFALATRHGIEGLLYRGLSGLRETLPPVLAPLNTTLAARFTEQALYYEFLYPQEIAGLLAAFASAGIPALLLKGHALGATVYGQPSLRPYGDIDLLVSESDLDAAEQLMFRLGYQASEDEHPAEWYRAQHHHLAPFVRAGALPVEIHRALVTPGSGTAHIQLDALWASARPLKVDGQSAQVLCLEHQLIYLCLHAVNTHFLEIGLKALCDVNEAMTQESLDWARVAQDAQAWKCARHITLMLRLIHEIMGTSPPAEARAVVQEQPDMALVAYSLGNMLSGVVAGMPESAGLAEVMEERSLLRRGLRVLARLFPPRSEIARRYGLKPERLQVWLSYPRWQADMVQRHAAAVWKMRRTDPAVREQMRQEARRRALVNWLAGS